MAAGLTAGVNRFDQDGVHPEAVAHQHVSEDPVPHHRDLVSGKIELLQHPPQGRAARFAGAGGEVHAQLLGDTADARSGGVVAEEVQGHRRLGTLQPGRHWLRQGGPPMGQQGSVHIKDKGPDPLG